MMTDREFVEATIREMHSRGLYGCIFAVPEHGGPSTFASSVPPGTVDGLTAAEQLAIFAKVASTAVAEKHTKLTDDVVFDYPKKDWVN
jgi:hypothetical protein